MSSKTLMHQLVLDSLGIITLQRAKQPFTEEYSKQTKNKPFIYLFIFFYLFGLVSLYVPYL